MKAKVIKAFYDLKDPARKTYQVGSEYEGSAARLKELAGKGFVELAAKAEVKEEEEVKAEKPRAKRGARKDAEGDAG